MPFWYAGTLLLTVAVAVVFPWKAGSWAVVGAGALFAAAIGLTIAILVPINNRVAGWEADALPSDWKIQRRRWDRVHSLRVVLLLAGWLALVAGVLMLCRDA